MDLGAGAGDEEEQGFTQRPKVFFSMMAILRPPER